MHCGSCIGINYAHRFPKCFRSLHTHCWVVAVPIYSISDLYANSLQRFTLRKRSCEVLSLHPAPPPQPPQRNNTEQHHNTTKDNRQLTTSHERQTKHNEQRRTTHGVTRHHTTNTKTHTHDTHMYMYMYMLL